MNEVARYATKVAVFDMGSVVFAEPPQQLFKKQEQLVKMGLDIPTLAKLRNMLVSKGINLPDDCLTVERMAEELIKLKKRRQDECSET